MRAARRGALLVAALAVALSLSASAASAATTLSTSPPKWFTPAFKAKVDAAGIKGVKKPAAEPGALDICPGIDPAAPTPTSSVVSAGTCEVFPAGCTANFIYSNGSQFYVGTAGHCVDDKVGIRNGAFDQKKVWIERRS